MMEKAQQQDSYSYKFDQQGQWIYCPNCRKRLFEVVRGKDFAVEILCRCCKKLITIER